MNYYELLISYRDVAHIHHQRLSAAFERSKYFFPINAQTLRDLNDEQVAIFDMMTTRFGKLQDILGSKIFPLMLDILGENAPSYRDKLNVLEKLKIIENAKWWMELREIRNTLTHDYPDNYDTLATHFNGMISYVEKLLLFWTNLQQTINRLPKN